MGGRDGAFALFWCLALRLDGLSFRQPSTLSLNSDGVTNSSWNWFTRVSWWWGLAACRASAMAMFAWAAILTQPFWGSYPSFSFATVSDEQLDRELRTSPEKRTRGRRFCCPKPLQPRCASRRAAPLFVAQALRRGLRLLCMRAVSRTAGMVSGRKTWPLTAG